MDDFYNLIVAGDIVHLDKLVRDKVPQRIEAAGGKCHYHHASGDNLRPYLSEKLREETAEYFASESDEAALGELADVLETVYRLAQWHGSDEAGLERLRRRKRAEKGSFEGGVVLDWATRERP